MKSLVLVRMYCVCPLHRSQQTACKWQVFTRDSGNKKLKIPQKPENKLALLLSCRYLLSLLKCLIFFRNTPCDYSPLHMLKLVFISFLVLVRGENAKGGYVFEYHTLNLRLNTRFFGILLLIIALSCCLALCLIGRHYWKITLFITLFLPLSFYLFLQSPRGSFRFWFNHSQKY